MDQNLKSAFEDMLEDCIAFMSLVAIVLLGIQYFVGNESERKEAVFGFIFIIALLLVTVGIAAKLREKLVAARIATLGAYFVIFVLLGLVVINLITRVQNAPTVSVTHAENCAIAAYNIPEEAPITEVIASDSGDYTISVRVGESDYYAVHVNKFSGEIAVIDKQGTKFGPWKELNNTSLVIQKKESNGKFKYDLLIYLPADLDPNGLRYVVSYKKPYDELLCPKQPAQ